MPDPKKYKTRNEWMSACVPAVKAEGKTQEQAVGQCMGMWRGRNKVKKDSTERIAEDLQDTAETLDILTSKK